ncbi:Stk1 family PASTA domain-containing Ser/Thr kinase [Pseudactinotalea sp. HY158]|uniref:Stk1 family PASTA domain-containing Ser/Thr kinase n=1 Tax=Pseudactinotalea sp. HY158 TaxID=2654547 RepID=UPI00129C358C|nr:Stk1 family PASTA domain-containing Ser/Thr kinase [Pseudactinotalea sp. HY158]QGH68140.1 Stk1 family PASTA domain-containing Ser/Thr kinase [Pseudactinotalea sp. HY158]
MADNVPRLLAERYEVGELIGRGGMAEVHIGRDTRLNRTVAVKVLRSDLLADVTFQARFRREAQSAASLNHPAIVSVYDTGEEVTTDAAGAQSRWPYIVMEYVEGHTVRDLLRDGSALPIDEAIEITLGVLTALEYSHHSGIVHRDIKPANVMLTPTGAVKVMDFGIARALADTSATMTQTQAVVGTAQYLSPEQARGEVVDARSDLYSTGCLLYELLTGRPPFVGDSAVAVAYQHVGEEPQPPSAFAPDVPEALDRILLKALTKDREQRYSSASAFRADLEAAAVGGLVQAPAMAAAAPATQVLGQPALAQPSPFPPVAEDEAAEEEPPSRKGLIWTLVILGVVIAGVVAFLLLNQDKEPPPTPQVAVPTLTNEMDKGDVTALLEEEGLVLDDQGGEASTDVAAGNATRWSPAVGTMVDEGSSVQVWFSTGPDAIAIPNVAGMEQNAARDRLVDAGFNAGNFTIEPANIADKSQGTVDRTEPAAQTEVSPDADITIIVATGNVEIPDFVGDQFEDVAAELKDLGISAATTFLESDETPGTVIAQDVSGLRPVNSSINLTVAKAPPPPTEEPSTPTESPSETETTTPPPTDDNPSPPPTDGSGDAGDQGRS